MSGFGDDDLLCAIDTNDLFKDIVQEEIDLDDLGQDQLDSPENNLHYLEESNHVQGRRMSAHDI